MDYRIAVIHGDGIGPEVVNEAIKVLNKVGEVYGHHFTYDYVLAGGCAIDNDGTCLPQETIDKCKKADAVLLMPGCADEFSPKVIRSGMGTHFRLPILKTDWDRAEKWLRSLPGMRILAADSDGGISCWETDLRGPAAIIIGSEGNGPCDRALELADARILIPMPGEIESLNAGIAAGILIFEVVRQRSI